MKLKSLFLFSFYMFFFQLTPCLSQTYIGLTTGLDLPLFSKNVPQFTTINENQIERIAFEYGIRLEQQIADNVFLSIKTLVNKNKHSVYSINYLPISGIRYQRIKSAIGINWVFKNNFHLGGGISHNYIPSLYNQHANSEREYKIVSKSHNLGFNAIFGFLYKNFLFELNYWNDIKKYGVGDYQLKSINAIDLSASYMIKLLNKNKKSKITCPRI